MSIAGTAVAPPPGAGRRGAPAPAPVTAGD
jgi:hypothetical protein